MGGNVVDGDSRAGGEVCALTHHTRVFAYPHTVTGCVVETVKGKHISVKVGFEYQLIKRGGKPKQEKRMLANTAHAVTTDPQKVWAVPITTGES